MQTDSIRIIRWYMTLLVFSSDSCMCSMCGNFFHLSTTQNAVTVLHTQNPGTTNIDWAWAHFRTAVQDKWLVYSFPHTHTHIHSNTQLRGFTSNWHSQGSSIRQNVREVPYNRLCNHFCCSRWHLGKYGFGDQSWGITVSHLLCLMTESQILCCCSLATRNFRAGLQNSCKSGHGKYIPCNAYKACAVHPTMLPNESSFAFCIHIFPDRRKLAL